MNEFSIEITQSEGFKKLIAAVEADENKNPGSQNYRSKLNWVVERAKHYSDKTGLEVSNIFDAWENQRDYWYMNYYQDNKFPLIEGDNVKVFETIEELREAVSDKGFRCPACNGVSKDPYDCDTGIVRKNAGVCDWKSYGLFGTMGKGAYVFVKSEVKGQNIFKPVAWESVS